MPFPFVAVTLPPDTPPAYVAALLDACSQAYGEGDCRAAEPTAQTPGAPPTSQGSTPGSDPSAPASSTVSPSSEPPGDPRPTTAPEAARILATVGWQDALRAEILLGLPYWRNSRWIEWHLDFKEQDHLVERHRAVGFALGRLAVTVAEVARHEREVQAVEVTEPQVTPEPTPPDPNPPPLPKPQTDTKPPTFVDPIPTPVDDESEASADSIVYSEALLGAELGTGFRGVRIGGTAGVELVFDNRFLLGVRGYLTGDAFHATFAGAELRGGLSWQPDPIEIQLALGASWNYVAARQDKAAFEHVVGGAGSLNFALSRTAISPFVSVGASLLQEGIDTNVDGLNAYGPVVPRVQFGIKVRPRLF